MSLVQDSPPSLRLSELLGVLSFGVDLGMGQPMDHVLRQSMIALGLAERIGLGSDEREAVYFGSLLAWVGCHIDAYEQAKWFGDDTVLKSDYRRVDFGSASAAPLFMARHLGGGRPLPQRIAMVPGFLGEGRRAGESLLDNHWRASDDLMERIGLDQLVRDTVEQSFERWDGRGAPKGASGSEILVTSQLINLADVVEVFHRAGGVEAAVGVARERAGTQFDPELVDTFAGGAEALFAELEATEPWQAVTGAEQASRYLLAHERLDLALEAVADFVDVKSPFTIGHSRGVATLAASAAAHYGLSERDTTSLRRAALVHDLGRLGVPNTIWDKPGPLGPAELEKARMHVYLTERMLAASPALSPLAAIASQHHERLDGSGYPRGLTGGDITPAGRILAAADSYHARLEPRPHRPAQSAAQAAGELREDVRAGRIRQRRRPGRPRRRRPPGDEEARMARRPHRPRGRRPAPAGAGDVEQGDRGGAGDLAEDGEHPPRAHLLEARRRQPRPGRPLRRQTRVDRGRRGLRPEGRGRDDERIPRPPRHIESTAPPIYGPNRDRGHPDAGRRTMGGADFRRADGSWVLRCRPRAEGPMARR